MMFTFQLPAGVPATLLFPLLGMAVLSLITCGSGLLLARWLRGGSLPLVHAILAVSLMIPLAAPLTLAAVWGLGWSPIRLVAVSADPEPTPPTAAQPSKPAPVPAPLEQRPSQAPEPKLNTIPPAMQAAPVTRKTPIAASQTARPEIQPAVASADQAWPVLRTIELGVATIWLLGTAYQLVWLAWGLCRVRRFEQTIEPETDPELLAVAQSAAERFALTYCPPLGRSAAIEVPLSLGLWRPRVILPAETSDAPWSAEAWLPLLIHEVAHIHRRDHIVGLMQRLALACYWWNPLAWAASRELALVREQICDDLATSGIVTGESSSAREYAEILVDLADRVAEGSADRGQYVSALAAWNGPGDDLSRRIHRLLDPGRQVVTSLGRMARVACGGFALVLLLLVVAVCVRVDHLAAQPPADAPPTGEEAELEVEGDKSGDKEEVVDLLEKTFLVVNQDGQPIEGAKVTPSGLSLEGGSSMAWTDGTKVMMPEPRVTDAQGVVIIEYPEYAFPSMQSRVRALFCHFEHSDYAAKRSELIYLNPNNPAQVTTIQLNGGAQIELVPRLEGELVKGGKLFADWTSRSYAPHLMATRTPEGHLQLPRVNPGTEIVRVAYISESGERYFSEAKRLELKAGETPVVEIDLEPGIVVRGELGDTVPRPVSEGSVVAVVAEKEESTMALVWQTYTKVDPDGSFTLEPMPQGTLQVIALCDGFMAQPDDPPAGSTEAEIANWAIHNGRPQIFDLDENLAEITIAMTPTADAEVRLLDPRGKPIAGTHVSFNPNVIWSHGSGQIYGYPLISSWQWMLDPAVREQQAFNWTNMPFSTKTDAQGVALINNLPPGLQTLYFPHEQYELAEKRRDQGNLPYNITQVELVPGQKNKFSFTLQQKQDPRTSDLIPAAQETIFCGPGVSQLVKPRPKKTFNTEATETELAGVVIDAQGKPLVGVEVDVWTWHPGNETTTDEEGRFRLTGLDRLSEVEVEFSKPGYCPSLYPSQKTGTQDWTVVLTQDTYREGQVLDPAGNPVPDALIRAARGPFQNAQVMIGQVWTETTTDAEGNYRLYLEPYDYDIQVRVPQIGSYRSETLKVARGSTERLDLKLEKGLTFRAKIINSETGEPIEGIQLWNWQHTGIEGTSNAEGLIEIDGMSPGEFEFMVTAVDVDRRRSSVAGKYARWWSEAAIHEHQRKEAVTEGQFPRNLDDLTIDIQPGMKPVEIFLEPAVTITGQVVDPEGIPVEGATVAPAKTGSGNSLTGDTRYSYQTDAEGKFTMILPASRHVKYNLIVHDGEYSKWRNWAAGVTEPFSTTPGELIEGKNLSLTQGATVRGKVVDAIGRAKPHTQVRAIGTDGLDNRYYVPTTKTDAEGNFELKFIRPGEHRIQAEPFWLAADQAPGKSTKTAELKPGEVIENVELVSQ